MNGGTPAPENIEMSEQSESPIFFSFQFSIFSLQFFPDDFPYIPLNLLARHHDLSAAFLASDLKIHADAQDEESVVAAGMGLLHDQFIVNANIHMPLLFFISGLLYHILVEKANNVSVTIQHLVKIVEMLDYI